MPGDLSARLAVSLVADNTQTDHTRREAFELLKACITAFLKVTPDVASSFRSQFDIKVKVPSQPDTEPSVYYMPDTKQGGARALFRDLLVGALDAAAQPLLKDAAFPFAEHLTRHLVLLSVHNMSTHDRSRPTRTAVIGEVSRVGARCPGHEQVD